MTEMLCTLSSLNALVINKASNSTTITNNIYAYTRDVHCYFLFCNTLSGSREFLARFSWAQGPYKEMFVLSFKVCGPLNCS